MSVYVYFYRSSYIQVTGISWPGTESFVRTYVPLPFHPRSRPSVYTGRSSISRITKNTVLLQFTDSLIKGRYFVATITHLECQLFVAVGKIRAYNERGLDPKWSGFIERIEHT